MSELQLLNKLVERELTPVEQRGIDAANERIQSIMFDRNGHLRTDSERLFWMEDIIKRAYIDIEMYREKCSKLQKK